MGIEIERKFLLAGTGWRAAVTRSVRMRQGYLGSDATASVRVRLEGDAARLNIKGATLGVARQEFEYPVPRVDAEAMLDSLCGGRTLSKVRHFVEHDGHTWEIDEFEGANAGLVVAEIELDAVDQAFTRPAWLGEEVSDDPRYYNACLVDHPYSEWENVAGEGFPQK